MDLSHIDVVGMSGVLSAVVAVATGIAASLFWFIRRKQRRLVESNAITASQGRSPDSFISSSNDVNNLLRSAGAAVIGGAVLEYTHHHSGASSLNMSPSLGDISDHTSPEAGVSPTENDFDGHDGDVLGMDDMD